MLWLAVIAILSTIFGLHSPGLKGKFSQLELNYLDSINTPAKVIRTPEFLPHKALTFGIQKIDYRPEITIRLPSAFIASISLLAGLIFIRKQFSARMSLIAGILLLSSSWLLSLGRLALPDISFILWIPLLATWHWLKSTNKQKIALLAFTLALGFAIYVPSFIFLIAAFWIWEKTRGKNDKLYINNFYKLLCLVVFLVMAAPLIYSIILNPRQVLSILGFPLTAPVISSLGSLFLSQLSELFLINNSGPVFTVGQLPLLDVFTTVFLILGIYVQKFQTKKTVAFMSSLVLFLLVLMSLGGPVTNAVLMPLIYYLAVCGIRFFLQQWFTVFPNNPIARSIGSSLVSLAVILVAFYHLGRYFVVWSNAPATRQVFNHSLLE